MHHIQLKQFYAPGGTSAQNIQIHNIQPTTQEYIYTGDATLPLSNRERRIVIYELMLESGDIDYRAVPAQCPHQGVDISRDEVKPDGNVYCSLHRRPICVYSEYNQAYRVEKRDGHFFIAQSC